MIGLPFWFIEVIGLLIFIKSKGHLLIPKVLNHLSSLVKTHSLLSFFILLIALIHSSVLIRSGWFTADGIQFIELSFHDSTQHLSIIKRLYSHLPISHPGFVGPELTSYHFMIDLLIASVSRFSFVNLYQLYYRIYPLFVSILFSSTFLVFVHDKFKNKIISALSLVLVILGGNASYFLQFFRGPEFSWGSNTFMINPIIDLLQNPASIFVFSQLFTVLLLVKLTEKNQLSKNQNISWLLGLSITAGTMITFKAWGGLLILGGLLTAGVYTLIKQRDPKILLAFIATLIISLAVFLPTYRSESAANLVFTPGWTLWRINNDSDRWNNIPDIFLQEHYLATSNYPRLFIIYSRWVGLYVFGNYWIRIVGLLAIFYQAARKIFRLETSEVIIFSITGASLVLPLLFNQGRMAYDIEQFSPYAIVFASIYTIHLIQSSLQKVTSKPWLMYTSLFLVVAISWPSNLTSLKARIFSKTKTITTAETEAFDFISTQTSPDAVFILYPSHRNIATLEFAAMTTRDTYFSGKTLSVITGENYEQRMKDQDEFFKTNDVGKQRQLITDHKISHLFLFAEDLGQVKNPERLGTEIFKNQAASVYAL